MFVGPLIRILTFGTFGRLGNAEFTERLDVIWNQGERSLFTSKVQVWYGMDVYTVRTYDFCRILIGVEYLPKVYL